MAASGGAPTAAVVGETPNLAARLQALAEPGAVLISSSTRRLIGGLFEYRNFGPVAVKGLAENLPAWQVLGAGTWQRRLRCFQTGLRSAETPSIAR
jgi:class 3 adenylate cyclase